MISDRSEGGRYQPSEDWVATVGDEETYVNIQGVEGGYDIKELGVNVVNVLQGFEG